MKGEGLVGIQTSPPPLPPPPARTRCDAGEKGWGYSACRHSQFLSTPPPSAPTRSRSGAGIGGGEGRGLVGIPIIPTRPPPPPCPPSPQALCGVGLKWAGVFGIPTSSSPLPNAKCVCSPDNIAGSTSDLKAFGTYFQNLTREHYLKLSILEICFFLVRLNIFITPPPVGVRIACPIPSVGILISCQIDRARDEAGREPEIFVSPFRICVGLRYEHYNNHKDYSLNGLIPEKKNRKNGEWKKKIHPGQPSIICVLPTQLAGIFDHTEFDTVRFPWRKPFQ